MQPPRLTVHDVKVFVPAQDFPVSLAFYQALGWQCSWQREALAELELAGVRFYLQAFYVKEWAENFMIYIVVADATAWYARIQEVIARGAYPGARVNPPVTAPHGALVTYAWDPSGVLLHFAQHPDAVA